MRTYTLVVTELALEDLQRSKNFYDEQDVYLGDYFIDL